MNGVRAMNTKTTLFLALFLLPQWIFALSIRDHCADKLPDAVDSGRIELTYSIDNTCKAVDLHFDVSEPLGAFEEYATCHIQRSAVIWNQSSDAELFSEPEYENRLEEFRRLNPDKYHQRSILVDDTEGNRIGLLCYFTGDWAVTQYKIIREGKEIPVDPEFIESLPQQNLELNIEIERPNEQG